MYVCMYSTDPHTLKGHWPTEEAGTDISNHDVQKCLQTVIYLTMYHE
jgi:hypothetical protein